MSEYICFEFGLPAAAWANMNLIKHLINEQMNKKFV